MTYQAICVDDSGCRGAITAGQEYTLSSLGGGMVSIPGVDGMWCDWRFDAIPKAAATTPAPRPPEAAVAPAGGLAGTLAARGTRYGSFETNGRIAQELKSVMRDSPNWSTLSGAQAEALDMFASKISRLLTGDPDYADNWHDIQGYAALVENTLPKN